MCYQKVIHFLIRQKFISFLIYMIHTVYMCTEVFFTVLDKGLRKNFKKKMGKLENKINEMGVLNMKLKK